MGMTTTWKRDRAALPAWAKLREVAQAGEGRKESKSAVRRSQAGGAPSAGEPAGAEWRAVAEVFRAISREHGEAVWRRMGRGGRLEE